MAEKSECEPSHFAALAVEGWRFGKVFEKALTRLDVSEAGRFLSQLDWFRKRTSECLADAGLSLVNLEGQDWEVGMSVTAINISEFEAGERLVIKQMIEPVVMGAKGVVRGGTVVLGRYEF